MQQFLKDKGAADSRGSEASPQASQALVAALHSLTGLRALLAGGLSSGMHFHDILFNILYGPSCSDVWRDGRHETLQH